MYDYEWMVRLGHGIVDYPDVPMQEPWWEMKTMVKVDDNLAEKLDAYDGTDSTLHRAP